MSHLSNDQVLFVGELTSRDKDHVNYYNVHAYRKGEKRMKTQ